MSEEAKGSAFVCALEALGQGERQRRHQLEGSVSRSVQRLIELSNGYALMLARERIDLAVLDEWIELEKRCCPFLNFRLRADSSGPELILELTGENGVKEFLQKSFARG